MLAFEDGQPPWTSLVRRIDDEAPLPYMCFFLRGAAIVVQISVPLCVRDQDLDGRGAHLPVRSLTVGEGPHFRELRPTVLRLVDPSEPGPRDGPAAHCPLK